MKQGKEEGLKQGREEGLKETAIKMLELKFSIEEIIKVTGLKKEEIEEIKKITKEE